MLGAFAVGKTSLVSRFVHSVFSDKYLTTVGVKIDKKPVTVDGRSVNLLIWDLAGEDELMKVRTSYLRGAAGYLLVADGTRSYTLETAFALRARVEDALGPLPYVILLNKADLEEEWELDAAATEGVAAGGHRVVRTSAKTGEGVEEAFRALAAEILE
jgi:small GTP-binding protein